MSPRTRDCHIQHRCKYARIKWVEERVMGRERRFVIAVVTLCSPSSSPRSRRGSGVHSSSSSKGHPLGESPRRSRNGEDGPRWCPEDRASSRYIPSRPPERSWPPGAGRTVRAQQLDRCRWARLRSESVRRHRDENPATTRRDPRERHRRSPGNDPFDRQRRPGARATTGMLPGRRRARWRTRSPTAERRW
jgi:hypothetical protein